MPKVIISIIIRVFFIIVIFRVISCTILFISFFSFFVVTLHSHLLDGHLSILPLSKCNLPYYELLVVVTVLGLDDVDTTVVDAGLDGLAWLDGERVDGDTGCIHDAHIGDLAEVRLYHYLLALSVDVQATRLLLLQIMIFFDAEGNELGSEGMFFAVDEPLPDGGEAVQDDCRFPLKYTEVPDHAEIRVLEYKTAEDIPPIHVPKEGEYLYKALNCGNLNALPDLLPKRITVHVDRMGYEQKAVFEAGNGLEEAVDAFMRIRVGEDDAPSVTDNYNWFLFEWEDDTSYMIRLSQYSLEYKTNACFHIFYLLDSEEFWAMAFDSLR